MQTVITLAVTQPLLGVSKETFLGDTAVVKVFKQTVVAVVGGKIDVSQVVIKDVVDTSTRGLRPALAAVDPSRNFSLTARRLGITSCNVDYSISYINQHVLQMVPPAQQRAMSPAAMSSFVSDKITSAVSGGGFTAILRNFSSTVPAVGGITVSAPPTLVARQVILYSSSTEPTMRPSSQPTGIPCPHPTPAPTVLSPIRLSVVTVGAAVLLLGAAAYLAVFRYHQTRAALFSCLGFELEARYERKQARRKGRGEEGAGEPGDYESGKGKGRGKGKGKGKQSAPPAEMDMRLDLIYTDPHLVDRESWMDQSAIDLRRQPSPSPPPLPLHASASATLGPRQGLGLRGAGGAFGIEPDRNVLQSRRLPALSPPPRRRLPSPSSLAGSGLEPGLGPGRDGGGSSGRGRRREEYKDEEDEDEDEAIKVVVRANDPDESEDEDHLPPPPPQLLLQQQQQQQQQQKRIARAQARAANFRVPPPTSTSSIAGMSRGVAELPTPSTHLRQPQPQPQPRPRPRPKPQQEPSSELASSPPSIFSASVRPSRSREPRGDAASAPASVPGMRAVRSRSRAADITSPSPSSSSSPRRPPRSRARHEDEYEGEERGFSWRRVGEGDEWEHTHSGQRTDRDPRLDLI